MATSEIPLCGKETPQQRGAFRDQHKKAGSPARHGENPASISKRSYGVGTGLAETFGRKDDTKCPACGSRRFALLFDVPSALAATRA
jgi:hypothetical protein